MPFSGISDFIRIFGTRFRDIYYENVDKGRITTPIKKGLFNNEEIK